MLGAAAGVMLAASGVASAAAAEEAGKRAASPPAVAAGAPTGAEPTSPADREERAAQLFRDAEVRYQGGDLAGAHRLMLAAYELSGRFELLFNLGQLERERQRCPEARRHYEAYLAHAPPGERRAQAQDYQLKLARACPEKPPEPPASPRVPAPVQHDPNITAFQIAGWSSLGATLLTGVAATYFALQAARQEDLLEARIRAAQSEAGQAHAFTQADKDLEAEGSRAANWARGLTVGAVGLAAVGVSLLIIDGRPNAGAAASFSIGWRAGAARAVYSTSF